MRFGVRLQPHGEDHASYFNFGVLKLSKPLFRELDPEHSTGSYAAILGSINERGTRFAKIANTDGIRSELISGKNVFVPSTVPPRSLIASSTSATVSVTPTQLRRLYKKAGNRLNMKTGMHTSSSLLRTAADFKLDLLTVNGLS